VATIEVMGEAIRATVPIPEGGATVRDLLRAASVSVREREWDAFCGGTRVSVDQKVTDEGDATVTYVPRTRGA
jgi:hypothetical protein